MHVVGPGSLHMAFIYVCHLSLTIFSGTVFMLILQIGNLRFKEMR